MKKIIFTLVLAMTIVMSYAQTINVAAAANLSYVMEEMKSAYLKTNKNAKINIIP